MTLFSPDIINSLNEVLSNIKYFHESFNIINFVVQPHVIHINTHVTKARSNPGSKPHSHRTFEFSLIRKGQMKYKIRNMEITLNGGDFVIIPPDVEHSWVAIDDSEIFGLMLFIYRKGVKSREDMNMLRQSIVHRNFAIRGFYSLQGKIEEILEEAQAQKIGFEEIIQCLTHEIYIKLLRKLLPGYTSLQQNVRIPPQRGDAKTALAELATYYINDNLSHKLTISDISSHLGVSVKKMCDVFKEKEGVTIQKYIARKRIERGSNLLLKTDRILSDIAASVGYEDVDYFCRVFKKHKGMTPSQFRKMI